MMAFIRTRQDELRAFHLASGTKLHQLVFLTMSAHGHPARGHIIAAAPLTPRFRPVIWM